MNSSDTIFVPNPVPPGCCWVFSNAGPPAALSLAQEKGTILVWDGRGELFLLDRSGKLLCNRRLDSRPIAAALADDGSAIVVAQDKRLFWLNTDLLPVWQREQAEKIISVAIDPFGQYVTLAGERGTVQIFDSRGNSVGETTIPRPAHRLHFLAESPFIIAAADFGLVVCMELNGKTLWREALVVHIGGIAATNDGSNVYVSGFSDGLYTFSLAGRKPTRVEMSMHCRLVAVAYDGRKILTADMNNQLQILNAEGKMVSSRTMEKTVMSLAMTALGNRAIVALADGKVVCLDLDSPQ